MTPSPRLTPRHGQPPTAASSETTPGEEDRERLRERAEAAIARLAPPGAVVPVRTVLLWGCALGALVVIAFAVLGLYTLSLGSTVADATSAEAVAANRQRAGDEVLGYPGQDCAPGVAGSVTFECLNRARGELGLGAVVPVDGLAPSQLGAVLGEARADLNRVREQRAEGAPGVGVSSSTPSGRFRGAR